MNYTILGLGSINGSHGGELIALWKMWQPSLGIGSLHWFGHSQRSYVRSPQYYVVVWNFDGVAVKKGT